MTEYRVLRYNDERRMERTLNRLAEQGYKLEAFSSNQIFVFAVVSRKEDEL